MWKEPPNQPATAQLDAIAMSNAVNAASQRARADTSCATVGFDVRPILASKETSNASLLQPTDNWPTRMVMKTASRDSPVQPRLHPNALMTSETAIVGNGWLALMNPRTTRMGMTVEDAECASIPAMQLLVLRFGMIA